MYLKNIGDCVLSRGEASGTPLNDPPLFWLDNIFKIHFVKYKIRQKDDEQKYNEFLRKRTE